MTQNAGFEKVKAVDCRYILLLLLLVQARVSNCYHDASNDRYHCWRLNATRNQSGVISCHGLQLDWEEPPRTVEKGQKFNVTYWATANEEFYEDGTTAFPDKNGTYIRELCQNRTCPENNKPDQENCCIWHANIHTCHPGIVGNEICGPWVGDDGRLSTHTDAKWGRLDHKFFAQDVQINFVGENFIIAHLKVGKIHIAIGQHISVTDKKFCGDGQCSGDIGETCGSCARDCCTPALPIRDAVGISLGVIAFVSAFIVSSIIVTVSAWHCLNRRKLFYDETWIINNEDIHPDTGVRGKPLSSKDLQFSLIITPWKGLMGSLVSIKNMRGETESVGLGESTTINSMQRQQVFTQTGIYGGRVVAVKKVPRNDLVVNNTVRKEVMQIRTLDHPNLCKFIGATFTEPDSIALISEYCPKGSLNDVLQNEDIPLNWGFRFSFATDIARAMAYMHSKKIYHGRLTSSNCTIDDRWTVKICDYGLPSFHQMSSKLSSTSLSDISDESSRRRQSVIKVYFPPEVRGMPDIQPSPTTDVYSYAIILIEIATRMDPFSDEFSLDSTWKPKIKLSDLSDEDCPCPHEYMDLISRCWSFLPHTRPTFELIKKNLHRINPSRESPVDMMMIMMEKYSKHLETLVAERTQELIAEQNKTTSLLYSMLPRQVADGLKHGKPAPATQFTSATIFFSDIVGFTSLASTSTPLQIVKLLNELYSTFDDILDQFDVYKVETIGDAYMVVSGVPEPNGDRHAAEIASMALALIAACDKFKIPHRQNTKLEVRAGVHSGPVCAGVVGLKMPRYCLFGDTVNTASRMETTSKAMKIQCSETTYNLLDKLGGFKLECRGNIDIKGKGSMKTWWIIDRNKAATDELLSPKNKPKLSLPELVKDAPVKSLKGSVSFKGMSSDDSFEADGHNMLLPGSVIEELN